LEIKFTVKPPTPRSATVRTRDAILYDKDTGVLKLVKLIKTQLARKPGRDSAAYQQINALEFRKY